MTKKKDQIFYIVVKGGYVGKAMIEKFIVTPQDIEEAMEGEEMEEEDALQDVLSNISAVYEQGWSRTMIFTEKEFESFKKTMTGKIKFAK
jgi:hypothetical protein